MKALVTAGPTYEAIDPVRFIGNRSSGKMGFAIAKTLAHLGYDVSLITGPVQLQAAHPRIERIDVESAAEMYAEAMKHADDYDIGFCTAAVSDFTPALTSNKKIKKEKGLEELTLRLVRTQDILSKLGSIKKEHQLLVGFSLETENAEENALGKLARKNADFIVMNTLQDAGAGFGHDTNKVTIYGKDGSKKALPLLAKVEVAEKIVKEVLNKN